jgi:hypothetical protein
LLPCLPAGAFLVSLNRKIQPVFPLDETWKNFPDFFFTLTGVPFWCLPNTSERAEVSACSLVAEF